MSLIQQIQQANDLKKKQVDVPEWGVKITLQEMTGFQRAEFEQEVSKLTDSGDSKDTVRMMALVIVCSAVSDDGSPAFTHNDIDVLAGKSLSVITALSQEAMKLASMTEDDIEELQGN